ncbi:uncharacterized protein JCM6883_001381 [Sporobolomyces salmoneus]|uniref:uncharacterized protein n=1 Tax=Sporobolomyces salmoneus TaxID=183962 RepID=UPI003173F7D2
MSVTPLQEQFAASLHLEEKSSPLSPLEPLSTPENSLKLANDSSIDQSDHFDQNGLDSEPEEGGSEDVSRGGGTGAIENSSSSADQPRFFPPLWLARRTFIYEKLKEQGIRSVADLGCGEGSLLSLLSVPAYHVDDFPSLYPPSTPTAPSVPSSYASTSSFTRIPPSSSAADSQSRSDKLSILRSIPRPDPSHAELHLRKLVGIDADLKTCNFAKGVIKPNEPSDPGEENRWIAPEFRFEELTTQVFCGNVEVFNESLEDCEALVLTEIIEHMTASALTRLPNLLFNVYSPRLIIITTPNHCFNPYFPPPSSSSSSPSSSPMQSTLHPDPTGRTSRVFRDPTHLFEFTPSEFESWCHDILDQCGSTDEYSLSFTGVGSLASYYSPSKTIPFPPPSLSLHPALSNDPYSTRPVENPERFHSTQIAIFTKRFSNESERSPRSARPVPLPFFSPPLSSSSSSGLTLKESPPLASPTTPTVTGAGAGDGGGFPLLARHKLVGSFVHRAHSNASICQSSRIVLEELKALFNSNAEERVGETKVGWLILSEIWRIGGLPSSTQDGEGERMCLREMVGGEIGALIQILLDEDEDEEWVFERVENAQGLEALRIGWKNWEGIERANGIESGEESGNEEGGEGLVFDGLRENGFVGTTEWGTRARNETITPSISDRATAGQNGDWGNPETGGWNDEW